MEVEKKSRRKPKTKVKQDTDIELSKIEKKEDEVTVIDESGSKAWTESEKSSPEKIRRKKKSKKKLKEINEEEKDSLLKKNAEERAALEGMKKNKCYFFAPSLRGCI